MESSGWAVMGAFTGDTGVNEWNKGRRRPASDALRDFYPHRLHQFLEAHQVQHPPSCGRSPLRRGEVPFEVAGQRRQAPLRPYATMRNQPLNLKVIAPEPLHR